MYGDPDGNIEKDYDNFMKYQQHRHRTSNADINNIQENRAEGVGKSKNINSNTDFTNAGMANMMTKHVPYAVRKGGY